jgi:hypothetical protein
MKESQKPERSAYRLLRCSALLGINIVTLILIIIVAIGQWKIYPRLKAMETKIESQAKQQSLQKSSPAQQQ